MRRVESGLGIVESIWRKRDVSTIDASCRVCDNQDLAHEHGALRNRTVHRQIACHRVSCIVTVADLSSRTSPYPRMSPSPPPAAAPAQEPEEQQPEKQEQEQAPVAEVDGEGDVKMDEPTADAEAVAEDEAAPDAEAEESSKPESSKSKPKSAGKSAPRPASKASKAKNISSSKDKDGAFSANDIVLAKLRGYPKWREYAAAP